jgi:hypothetical protein
MTDDMGASNSSARPPGSAAGNHRVTLILAAVAAVAAIAAIAGGIVAWPNRPEEPAPVPETRMPITNPVLEPDRPDLLGAPHEPARPE